jgi:hypothetical protein
MSLLAGQGKTITMVRETAHVVLVVYRDTVVAIGFFSDDHTSPSLNTSFSLYDDTYCCVCSRTK